MYLETQIYDPLYLLFLKAIKMVTVPKTSFTMCPDSVQEGSANTLTLSWLLLGSLH